MYSEQRDVGHGFTNLAQPGYVHPRASLFQNGRKNCELVNMHHTFSQVELEMENPLRTVKRREAGRGREGRWPSQPPSASANAVMYRKRSVINGRNALSPVPHTLTQEFRTESGPAC